VSFLRRCGAIGTIAGCAFVLAFASSPELHEGMIHHGATSHHACAIMVRAKAKSQSVVRQAKPLAAKVSIAPRLAELATLNPIWVPKLFLEACRLEHGPPVL
jgi:hypothetical protein